MIKRNKKRMIKRNYPYSYFNSSEQENIGSQFDDDFGSRFLDYRDDNVDIIDAVEMTESIAEDFQGGDDLIKSDDSPTFDGGDEASGDW